MLRRVVYTSETVGSTGVSALSLAQILGVSERNNRRDHITSCVMFHDRAALQIIEGARTDVDRLFRRLCEDLRHHGLRTILDRPIEARSIHEPMSLYGDSVMLLTAVGQPGFANLSANDAERIVGLRIAA